MNLLHMKYAVEVAKCGSINKAAETLLIAQPNLSRAIKELESDLGIVIFERSPKGMVLTPKGEEFVGYAISILNQISSVERKYKNGLPMKRRFSVSGPRATYISEALVQFSKHLGEKPVEVFYKETNTAQTIQNLLYDDYKLGIMRYSVTHEEHFERFFEEKGLVAEPIAEFHYVLIVSKYSPLAVLPEVRYYDTEKLIEIAHADPFVPSLSSSQVEKKFPGNITRKIHVFERGSQFELLSENPEIFMWVSPIPQKVLDRYDLVQRECIDVQRIYRDVLIYKKGYRLTELDRRFVAEVQKSRDSYL